MIVPYRWLLLLVVVALVATTALEMIPPFLLRMVVDEVLTAGRMNLLYILVLSYAGIYLVRGVLLYIQWYTQEYVGQKVMFDFRRRLHDHLQNLSPNYFARIKTGQMMSRLTGDVESLQHFLGFGALLMFQMVLFFVVVSIILLNLNWRLTLVTLATSPLLAITVFRFDRKLRPAWESVREYMARLTTTLQENISGVRVVKAFAREDTESLKFSYRNLEFFDKNMDRARVEAGAQPLLEMLSGLCAVLLIWYGGREVVLERMTLGTLVAFQNYLWALIWPIRMMGWLVNMAARALAAAPRLFEILDMEPEVADAPDAVELPDIKGHIAMKNVSFIFDDGNSEVLKDINLEILPGETVAVVGGTGSGKSTFISLLARFHDPTQGQITVDGYDLRDVKLKSLRRQIGIVLQESFLFSTSLKENIAFGNAEASTEDIRHAARLAQVEQFIDELPQGYDTLVGERGVGLSGGQKQRVSLARALLVDPKILILDEATASVDTETESQIQAALTKVMQNRTTVVIAKRLSTVKSADKILVLEDGQIAQFGTHEELSDQEGVYRRIFASQLAGQEEAVKMEEVDTDVRAGTRH